MADRSLPILILAAGQSRRMRGRDKLMEPIDGLPLIHHMATRALATGHPVTVALPPAPHPRYDALHGLPLTTLPVPDAALGLNRTLSAGLTHLASAPATLIVLADLPDLTTGHMTAVFAARSRDPDAEVWRGTTANGKPGHPTLIDQSLYPAICALTGDQGAQPVLKSAKTHCVPLPQDAARHDLDTPEDWADWRAKRT